MSLSYGNAFGKIWLRHKLLGLLDIMVGLECREKNRPFSEQQHQAQFGLNPALGLLTYKPVKGRRNFIFRSAFNILSKDA